MLCMNSALRGIAIRRIGLRYASTTRKQLVVDSKTLKKVNNIKDNAKNNTKDNTIKANASEPIATKTAIKPETKATKSETKKVSKTKEEVPKELTPAVENLCKDFMVKGDIAALTEGIKSLKSEEGMPLYQIVKVQVDKPKAYPVEVVNQFYWTLFEKIIAIGQLGVDDMFSIIAEKYTENTLKFDEKFYKHFFYELLHAKNYDMAHFLYSTMTTISNIEADILTLSIADRVANFVLSVEEKEDPKFTKFFEDVIQKGESHTIDEDGYETLMEYWVSMEQLDRVNAVFNAMQEAGFEPSEEIIIKVHKSFGDLLREEEYDTDATQDKSKKKKDKGKSELEKEMEKKEKQKKKEEKEEKQKRETKEDKMEKSRKEVRKLNNDLTKSFDTLIRK